MNTIAAPGPFVRGFSILGAVIMLLSVLALVPSPARAAGFTQTQVQSILSLLGSFGVDKQTADSVRSSLGGSAVQSQSQQQTVAVTNFPGVDITGATDSTAGIRAAVASGASKVTFPCGTYLISGAIGLPSNIEIAGSGTCTVVRLAANTAENTRLPEIYPTAGHPRDAFTNSDFVNGNQNISIHDLTVDGTVKPRTNGFNWAHYISFFNAQNVTVERVRFIGQGTNDVGLSFVNSSGFKADNNYAYDLGTTCYSTWAGSHDFTFSNNICDGANTTGAGIIVNGAGNDANNASDWEQTTYNGTISANTISNVTGVGLDITGLWNGLESTPYVGLVRNITVTNNTVTGVSGYYGIRVGQGSDLTVSGNTFKDVGQQGIVVGHTHGPTSNVTVTGNTFTNTDLTTGVHDVIKLIGQTDRTTLSGNVITGARAGYDVAIHTGVTNTSICPVTTENVSDFGTNTTYPCRAAVAVGAAVAVTNFPGVDITGATDSTAGIRAAVASGASKVTFPCGTYLISGAIGLPSNIEIAGSGTCTVVRLAANTAENTRYFQIAPAAGHPRDAFTNADFLNGNQNIDVHDMTIDGTVKPRTNGFNWAHYISFFNAQNVTVERVRFIGQGTNDVGLSFVNSSGFKADNNYAYDLGTTCYSTWAGSHDFTFSNNICNGANATFNGIVVNGAGMDPNDQSDWVRTTYNGTVSGNTVSNVTGLGFDITGLWNVLATPPYGGLLRNITVTNNTVTGVSGYYGIRVGQGSDLTVTNNTFKDVGQQGIVIGKSYGPTTNVTVTGNTFTNTDLMTGTHDAILVIGKADHTTLSGNVVEGGRTRYDISIDAGVTNTSVCPATTENVGDLGTNTTYPCRAAAATAVKSVPVVTPIITPPTISAAPSGSLTASNCTTTVVGGTCPVSANWNVQNSFYIGTTPLSVVNVIDTATNGFVGGSAVSGVSYYQNMTSPAGSYTFNLKKGTYVLVLYGWANNNYVLLGQQTVTVSDPVSAATTDRNSLSAAVVEVVWAPFSMIIDSLSNILFMLGVY